jgi:hypothetical protein
MPQVSQLSLVKAAEASHEWHDLFSTGSQTRQLHGETYAESSGQTAFKPRSPAKIQLLTLTTDPKNERFLYPPARIDSRSQT